MDLHPTGEHLEIIASAADFLARELPADEVPKRTETAISSTCWRGMAEMGWFGMGLSAEMGGLGLSVVEEALVLRELGRGLAPPQVLATMLGAHLAADLTDRHLADALISGERRVAFAVPAEGSDTERGQEYRLIDTNGTDLVISWDFNGAFLANLDDFTQQRVIPAIDSSMQAMTASLDESSPSVRRSVNDDDFLERGRLCLAAVLTGGAEASRDMSAEYAKVRQQFGKPIGSFQAIAHPIAQMAVRCEAAFSILQFASVWVRDRKRQPTMYAAAARSVAQNAAYENAVASMQVFGGYGQTYDYLPHLFLKRAMIYRQLGGGVEADDAAVLDADSTL